MLNSYCEYRDAIRQLGDDEEAPKGWDMTRLDRNGNYVEGFSLLLPVRRNRIAVRRDFRRSISNAAEQIKAHLEPRIFQTREKTEFNLDLRISIDPTRTNEIAKKHFDETLSPQDLFFRYFANELLLLLESSAARETGTIDERIGRNKLEWQKKLEIRLTERFGVGVEIIFLIAQEVSSDKIVRTPEGAYHHVYFRDRIDKTYPISIDLRLRQVPGVHSTEALPREEQKLKNNLFAVIAKCCEQSLTLYDYWYQPDHMEATIAADLDAYLRVYAHSISNIQIKRPDTGASTPPLKAVKLQSIVPWKDNRGYSLEFSADARALISDAGAGLYDKSGRKDRQQWFEEAIAHALKNVLAGASINDLSDEQLRLFTRNVEALIKEEAASIGLELELFLGEVLLPNQKWMRQSIVSVAADDYDTAHPNIQGSFSMDIEVKFNGRKALESFLTELRSQAAFGPEGKAGGGDTALRPLPDEYIEQRIRDAAIEAARVEMKGIDAEDYFTDFTRNEKWAAAIAALNPPGSQPGGNRIRDRLAKILENRYPGVELQELLFHRLDRKLEGLRNLIGELHKIEFTCEIPDRRYRNAALNRKLTGHVFVDGGDASQVVKMLNRNFTEIGADKLRQEVANHLKVVVEGALSHASQAEIESLMESLTATGGLLAGDLREALKARIIESMRQIYGFLCGRIDLQPALSKGEETLAGKNEEILLGPIIRSEKEYRQDSERYDLLRAELATVTGTTSEDHHKREVLKREISSLKEQLEESEREVNRKGGQDIRDYIADVENLFGTPQITKEAPSPAPNENTADDDSHSPPRSGDTSREDDAL